MPQPFTLCHSATRHTYIPSEFIAGKKTKKEAKKIIRMRIPKHLHLLTPNPFISHLNLFGKFIRQSGCRCSVYNVLDTVWSAISPPLTWAASSTLTCKKKKTHTLTHTVICCIHYVYIRAHAAAIQATSHQARRRKKWEEEEKWSEEALLFISFNVNGIG